MDEPDTPSCHSSGPPGKNCEIILGVSIPRQKPLNMHGSQCGQKHPLLEGENSLDMSNV